MQLKEFVNCENCVHKSVCKFQSLSEFDQIEEVLRNMIEDDSFPCFPFDIAVKCRHYDYRNNMNVKELNLK